ncbi:hypothetical protein EN794_050490 [Mesorhizobium sp. M00.F.Ca.ET.151.01.1.1]|nr:hypothetical protein EN794_050490 [Mesorhizobium sp. M00.F.Ca.ET.151.01.1.1]
MILYHYTCREYLASILATGLWRGEVCTDSWQKPDGEAVWLTTDSDPAKHGLGSGEPITEDFRRAIYEKSGIELSAGSVFADKRAVRITVDIPPSDTRLFRWIRWAKRNVHPVIRDGLISSGGGMAKARTWYVYFGVIMPDQFLDVGVADDAPLMKEAA